MAYQTKIKIADAYEIMEQTGSAEQPYISNVLLTEATAVGSPSIGGSAANTLALRIYNSPITSLEGVKVELFAREVVGDTIEISVSNIEADEPAGESNDSVDDAILREFGISSIEQIDTAENAEIYDIEETTFTAPSMSTDDSNEQYRSTDEVVASTITDTVPDNGDEEWIPMGVFYVQSISNYDSYIGIVAYDSFINMTSKFVPTNANTTISALYEDFRSKLSDLEINSEEESEFPSATINWSADVTLREAAGYFATFMGAYANFDRYGTLDLVKYLKNDTYMITLDDVLEYSSSIDGGLNISGVACNTVGDTWLVTPTGTERGADVIDCENPMMTQAILNTVLETYQYLVYQPCVLTVNWQPTIKAGDIVEVERPNGNIWVCIHNLEIDFTQGKARITSLGDPDAVSKYQSPTIRKLIEAGKTATNYITEDESGALVIRRDTDDYNVRIDADSVDIRNGETVLASFGEETTLGETGTLKMCSPEHIQFLMEDGTYTPARMVNRSGITPNGWVWEIYTRTNYSIADDSYLEANAIDTYTPTSGNTAFGSTGLYYKDTTKSIASLWNEDQVWGNLEYLEEGSPQIFVQANGNTGSGFVSVWRATLDLENKVIRTRLVSNSSSNMGTVTLSYQLKMFMHTRDDSFDGE